MKASRLMTRDVHTVLPETTIAQAWTLMHDRGIRHLPVVQEGKLVGLVSDRDLLAHAAKLRSGSFVFSDTVVGEVMSLNPVVCPKGTPVSEIAETLIKEQIDCVPIVSVDNQLVGLVTSTDLVAVLLDKKAKHLPFVFRVSSASAHA